MIPPDPASSTPKARWSIKALGGKGAAALKRNSPSPEPVCERLSLTSANERRRSESVSTEERRSHFGSAVLRYQLGRSRLERVSSLWVGIFTEGTRLVSEP